VRRDDAEHPERAKGPGMRIGDAFTSIRGVDRIALRRTLWRVLALVVGVSPSLVVVTTAPDARADESQYLEFYTPPDPLPPGAPGDLIRTEPSRLVLEPSGQLGMIMADATRIMYRSTDVHGNPMAVTGTYFEPYNDWPGGGPRPLIVYGPGTQGQGDQCAPSR